MKYIFIPLTFILFKGVFYVDAQEPIGYSAILLLKYLVPVQIMRSGRLRYGSCDRWNWKWQSHSAGYHQCTYGRIEVSPG